MLTIREKIEASRKAISQWNRNQQRNSRLVIKAKKAELETAFTDEANDTELIKKIYTELKAAYLTEEAY